MSLVCFEVHVFVGSSFLRMKKQKKERKKQEKEAKRQRKMEKKARTPTYTLWKSCGDYIWVLVIIFRYCIGSHFTFLLQHAWEQNDPQS